VLDVSIHKSTFHPSEVVRVDIDTSDVKRAIIVHYLSSRDSIVVDLVRNEDPVYDRLLRLDLNKVEEIL